MNVIRQEFKANLKGLLLWTACAAFLILAGMAKYSGLSSSEQSLNDLVLKMPQAFRALMGMGEFDLSTPFGYFGIIWGYLLLIVGIYAISLSTNIIAKEEKDKTSEFLLTKPISRSFLFLQKATVVLLNSILINLAMLVFSLGAISAYVPLNEALPVFIKLSLGMFLLQLLFVALGLALAGSLAKGRRAGGVGTYILLFSYFVGIIMGFFENVEWLRPLSFFRYFDTAKLINGDSLQPLYIALSVVLVAVLLPVGIKVYNRRDLAI